MSSIDFSKYKRFFAFGCSFTRHVYPTWADVVSKEMPDAEFYNYGVTGGGNMLINIRLAEANLRFNFCETDLVMVMYSTFCREDRWIDGEWQAVGNIYNNHYYDKDYIMKYTDPVGFLIRDFAQIYSTHSFIKSLPCDSFFMMSSDHNFEFNFTDSIESNEVQKEVFKIYKPFLDTFPEPIFGSFIDVTDVPYVKYISFWDDHKPHLDHHPSPDIYSDYLKHIGVPLTEKSDSYVKEAMDKLKLCKHHTDFHEYFAEEAKYPKPWMF